MVTVVFFAATVLFGSLGRPLTVVFIVPVSCVNMFLAFCLFKLGFSRKKFTSFMLLYNVAMGTDVCVLGRCGTVEGECPLLLPMHTFAGT